MVNIPVVNFRGLRLASYKVNAQSNTRIPSLFLLDDTIGLPGNIAANSFLLDSNVVAYQRSDLSREGLPTRNHL